MKNMAARDHDAPPADASAGAGTAAGWDASYTADGPAPWDIGRPQAAFVRLADDGLLGGTVLTAAFADGWAVTAIEASTFELNRGFDTSSAQAWLATIRHQ
jgi:hypothetical protein